LYGRRSFYFILSIWAIRLLYLIFGCPFGTISFHIIFYFIFAKLWYLYILFILACINKLLLFYCDKWMNCIFLSLTCTCFFAYTRWLSSLSNIHFFCLGCDIHNIFFVLKLLDYIIFYLRDHIYLKGWDFHKILIIIF
jgi:hypothetical protein